MTGCAPPRCGGFVEIGGVGGEKEGDLTMAVRHVVGARRIVAKQRARIPQMRAAGRPTLDAEQPVQIFESTLQLLEDHGRFGRK